MRDVSVLLTRFSLPNPVWKTRSAADYAAWLEVRLELLARFTVPSVRNLYVKPDRWLIFAGRHDAAFLARLDAIVQTAGLAVSVVPYTGTGMVQSLGKEVAGGLELPIRLCTARLDSDDLIASDYFARVHTVVKAAQDDADFAISFPGGAVYDAAKDRFSYLSYPDNPFLAHVERVTDWAAVKSVFRAMHTTLLTDLPGSVYLRSNHPMWSSVVHEHNLANQSLLRGISLSFVDVDALKQKFGLSP